MKRKEENRSSIAPSCTFFKPNKINFLPSNRVLDRKPDRVTGYKVLIDLTSLIHTQKENDASKRYQLSIFPLIIILLGLTVILCQILYITWVFSIYGVDE